MLKYQHQNSTQTLAEGMEEYFTQFSDYFNVRKKTEEAEEFFRCHDTAHVVFGCDIELNDEVIVKIASILGTSGGVGILKGYRLAESQEIYEELSISKIVATVLASFILVPQTVWRCARMKIKWPWTDYDQYLALPLSELREEFGIRVPHRH